MAGPLLIGCLGLVLGVLVLAESSRSSHQLRVRTFVVRPRGDEAILVSRLFHNLHWLCLSAAAGSQSLQDCRPRVRMCDGDEEAVSAVDGKMYARGEVAMSPQSLSSGRADPPRSRAPANV